MRQSTSHTRKILVVIDISCGASARYTLAGLFAFVNRGIDWSIQIVQPTGAFTPELVRSISTGGFAGAIVTKVDTVGATEALLETRLPLVFIDVEDDRIRQRPNTTQLFNDNAGVSRLALRHLAALGRRNVFAFVPAVGNEPWSRIRETAFLAGARALDLPCAVFEDGNANDPDRDHRSLCAWLQALPKPAAVMAAWDYRAAQVSNACAESAIKIPEDVALIGVDNDELFCNSTPSKLSSVCQDMESCGYRAGVELDRLFRRGAHRLAARIVIPAKGIVERESTDFVPPGTAYVNRAIEFIAANSNHALDVSDVVHHIGTSRRALEKHFRAIRGETIRQALVRHRLSRVKQLVCRTKRPFGKIAAECGFSSPSALAHHFKRETGLSLREARKSGRA